jgi:hypothetical protein
MATKKTQTRTVSIRPVQKAYLGVRVRSTSPLIQHAFGQKQIEQMRAKQVDGKKTRSRELKNPEECFNAAMHLTRDGRYAIPSMAFKKSLINAAHQDLGVPKTLVKKGLFVLHEYIPMETDEPIMREDPVPVGSGMDLRYRPEFAEWSALVEFEYDGDLLLPEDVINLLERAGFGVGLHEMRPEKGGSYGRFEVDREAKVQTERPS